MNLHLDVGDLSETGGWGDPAHATAERGAEIIARLVDFSCEFVTEFRDPQDERPAGESRS